MSSSASSMALSMATSGQRGGAGGSSGAGYISPVRGSKPTMSESKARRRAVTCRDASLRPRAGLRADDARVQGASSCRCIPLRTVTHRYGPARGSKPTMSESTAPITVLHCYVIASSYTPFHSISFHFIHSHSHSHSIPIPFPFHSHSHSNPIQSNPIPIPIPIQSNPFQSIPFHSIPFHSIAVSADALPAPRAQGGRACGRRRGRRRRA